MEMTENGHHISFWSDRSNILILDGSNILK